MPSDAHFYRQLIFLLWGAWALYWIVSALRTKTTRRSESVPSRLTHVLLLTAGGVLLAWHDVPWPWLTQRLWPRSLTAYCSGVMLLAAGIAFAIWARTHLGANWSGTVTVKEDHELIRSGPYAWVRHPIYTGLISAVLGTAIASGTVRAALGFLIIVIALTHKSRVEERFMSETFGGDYQRYRAAVPALIPFTRLPRSAQR